MPETPTATDPNAPFHHAGSNGAAVLVLHGFTAGPAGLLPWARAFAGAGYTVSLPLLPGHGTRWQDLAATKHTEIIDAVRREHAALAATHSRVFVAGLSMGGALALHLASTHAVAGLALVNPGLTLASPLAPFTGVLRHLSPTVAAIANDIAKPGGDEHAYDRTPVAGVHELRKLFRDTIRRLPQVTAPVVVFRSDTDHVVPESSLEALRAGLDAGVHLEVNRLTRSLHVATLDYEAEKIFARSIEFFQEVDGNRP
ncbi:alpha/beta fold hydrolase [Paeniglutamicibacter sp. ABSL32-1]|uniref:alpha/beta hydrolase n=1 Tax=Paeniglutamicibacter quisquiliarum TaxID=2849498 RepID=UPI001C2CE305|nr:alpha/beta fold hydrolase [Paeniglutamicibacter quisquiliarum]MBV1780448.1 alpha/beta fold hydrolase [Paeniglutamicibacter quisquiliarum]